MLTLIAAMSENCVIGRGGKLPWHLPDDLRRFKSRTTGHTIIMGRRTWESIGIALPNRKAIVITRQEDYHAAGARVVHDLEAALTAAPRDKEVFIIGGGEIYRQSLPRADRLDLTIVHAEIEGDTYFPAFDERDWTLINDERHEADEKHKHPFSFRVYERKS